MFKYKKTTYLATVLAVGFVSLIPRGKPSGRIEFDLKKSTAVIKSEFRFFGNVKPDVIEPMVKNIEKQWSGQPTHPKDTNEYDLYLVHKGRLKLSTEITYTVIPSIEEAKKQYQANKDPSVTFVRMGADGETDSSRAEMGDLGGGCLMQLNYHDRLTESTSAIHEFGHTLGLAHAANAWNRNGPPRIMVERGAPGVDAEYGHESGVRGTDGKMIYTLDPTFRRVRQEDLTSIEWKPENISYEPGSEGMRGTIRLGYCYDQGKKSIYFKPVNKR